MINSNSKIAGGPEAIFDARSVAVVGASQKTSFVTRIIRNLVKNGFTGTVSAVNPRYENLDEVPCYPSLAAVPGDVDFALVGVAAEIVPAVLADFEAKHTKAAIVVSSGYADMGTAEGLQRQAMLTEFAQRTGIRIGGPNCLGAMNAHNGLIALPTEFETLVPGHVSAVLQSGMLVPSFTMPLMARGIGVSRVISTGNEADLDAAAYIENFVEDQHTKVIACYIEQIRDARRFEAACEKAAENGKPIVLIKIGSSDGGRHAALAHTGSMVGSDDVTDAMLRRLGVIRVASVDDLVEAVAALHARRLPRGNRVAFISPSGGASGIISDCGEKCGVNLPAPSADTVSQLKTILPAFGTAANPLDITGQGIYQTEILEKAIDVIARSNEYDVVVLGRDFPAGMDRSSPVGRVLEAAVAKYPEVNFLVSSIVGGKMFTSLTPGESLAEPTVKLDGVPFLQGTETVLQGLNALTRYGEFQRRRLRPRRRRPEMPDNARRIIAEAVAAGNRVIGETVSKELFASYGISGASEVLAATAAEATKAAAQIGGRVALKIDSQDIAHKTEAGGVLLNIDASSASDITQAFELILSNVRAHAPTARIRGVLVQEMVLDGLEFVLGMTVDPQFGPVVACGLGGILVEVMKDIRLLIPPFDVDDVKEELAKLRGAALLRGIRGQAASDTEALANTAVRFGDLALDLAGSVSEIDINPLLVRPAGRGVIAVDGLIVLNSSESLNSIQEIKTNA